MNSSARTARLQPRRKPGACGIPVTFLQGAYYNALQESLTVLLEADSEVNLSN